MEPQNLTIPPDFVQQEYDLSDLFVSLEYDEGKLSTQTDLYHSFPRIFIDEHIVDEGMSYIPSGNQDTGYTEYAVAGYLNSVFGAYTIGIRDGVVTHRFFVKEEEWSQRGIPDVVQDALRDAFSGQ